MSHLNINGVDKPLDHIRLNNVRSENLFNATWNSGSIGANGGMIADTNAVRTTAIPCSAEKTYTFVPDIDDCDSMWVNYYGTTNTRERIDTIGGTFTTPQGCEQIRFRVTKSNIGVTPVQQYNAMLNEGSTAKPYEPYLITKEAWEARTRVILHNLTNPLCGIGTYKDTLDLSTGVLTRYIKKLVLTGEEADWSLQSINQYGIANFTRSISDRKNLTFRLYACSHFIVQETSISSTTNVCMRFDDNKKIFFRILSTTCGDVDEWKAFLAAQYAAGTPVMVWYVLETPETEQITVPSNLTGIVEGYLTQSSTPSPTSPVYPIANGTLEQGGTYSLDTGAYAIAWGRADTFTGTNPMSARCYGLPIKSWEIDGNTKQDETPSPDNLIYPQFVGEKTENLFDGIIGVDNKIFNEDGWTSSNNNYAISKYIPVEPNTSYTYHFYHNIAENRSTHSIVEYDSNKNVILPLTIQWITENRDYNISFTTQANTAYIRINWKKPYDEDLALNLGSTALPYEPFGYKLPITSAGQTQNVYLGEVQTTRKTKKLVLDGTENWTSLSGGAFYALPIAPNMLDRNTLLSTHFFVGNYSGALEIGQLRGGGAPSNTILFNYDNGAIGVDGFKQWLAAQYAAGMPVTIWYALATPTTGIVNEPLAKIGTYADTLISEQAGITIPTTDGNNIISVDTTLAPSKMTITGHIRDVWFEQSITGVPPLSFKSNGTPIISLSMKGNGQQNGTPTPDAPIMPTFCGEKTAQLLDKNTVQITNMYARSQDGVVDGASNNVRSCIFLCNPNTTYTVSKMITSRFEVAEFDSKPSSGSVSTNWIFGSDSNSITITTGQTTKYLLIWFFYAPLDTQVSYQDVLDTIMVNEGPTPLPYEPYGWKIPVTSAGQTQNVYLGQVQTTRKIKKLVLTGEEAWRKSTNFPGGFFVPWSSLGGISASPTRCTHAYGVPNGQSYVYGTFLSDATNFNIRIMQPGTEKTEWEQFLSAQYAAGTPVTIWYVLKTPETSIVNEPLCKISNYVDELNSTDTEVSIPTANGENTLTVDTDLQPSEMTITGYIKQE